MKKSACLLLLSGASFVFAQSPVTVSYDTENGLGSQIAYTVFVDSRGIVWAGTDGNGVAMFDGKNMHTFTEKDGLCGNTIACIKEDNEGKMWFGSMGYGLSIFDGKTFTNYTPDDSTSGLTAPFINCLHLSSKNEMYLGTYGHGMLKYVNGKFVPAAENMPEQLVVWQIIEDKAGTLWFSTNAHGLGKLTGNTMTFLGEKEGIPLNMTLGLAFDVNGDILMGTSYGLFRIRDEKMFQAYDQTHGFYENPGVNSIRSLYVAKNGDILMGFYNNFWRMQNDTVVKHKKNGELTSAPTGFAEDNNGNLWIATESSGLVRYRDNGISVLSNPSYGEGFFMNMQSADDRIYLATPKIIYTVQHGRCVPLIDFDGYKMNDVVGIFPVDTSNILIFSNDHGINRCTEKNEKWSYEHVSKLQFFFIEQLTDSLICGTIGGSGIFTYNVYTDQYTELYDAATPDYNAGLVYAIEVNPADGHIWTGTYDSQSIIELTGTDTIIYKEENGVPAGAIVDLEFDAAGTLWFLNQDGIFGYKKDDQFINFTSPLQAAADAITFDRNGNAWIGNAKGVLFVELDNYTIKSWRQFSSADGIPEVRGFMNATYTMNDGRIMVSKFDDACYIIDPAKIQPDIEKPYLYLQGVFGKDHAALDSTWYEHSTGFFHTPEKLLVPYSQNNLTFDMGVVYYAHPDSVRYSYLLEGFHEAWSIPQESPAIIFTNLPPGDYLFKCKAIGSNNNESEVVSFAFTVETPWYRTWLFYVLSVILLFTLIYLFVRWRLSRLEKDKLRLEAIVEERTREVVDEKEKVEEKNREILDSITYAKRIQAAILPPPRLVKEYLTESFVIYIPKDIVAGDFYWMHTFAENKNQVIFAAADCTGHGVPGAMVSVVCNNGLNRSVREYGLTDPGKILDKTREIIIGEFEKSEEEVKDGMDISLCALNTQTLELNWAGANNPLWIIQQQDGKAVLNEIKADKQPIGKYSKQTEFTSHKIQLQKNDLVYIFTDGFQDQFGGEKGKKFKASSLKELFLRIHHMPVEQQRLEIVSTFEAWKGSFEQLDDICLIGVRV